MRYRKKPVVIEAFQIGAGDPTAARPSWFVAAIQRGQVWFQGGDGPYYTIKTLEGEMRANHGDWIIRGVKGELYPCKPDIFAATYEPVQ
jgi:hypothetical protein